MNFSKIKDKLEKKKSFIKKNFYIKEIGIFGSFIRREQTGNSDIDVLVEFEKGHKDFFNYVRLKYHLEELFGIKVDLVIKGAVKPGLRKRIFNEVEYV